MNQGDAMHRSLIARWLCLPVILSMTACASLDLPLLHVTPRASKSNPVVQVACMWEPSHGRDPDGAPCRGFAGQLLFLGNKGGTPVAVDGEVMIYVFDDVGTEEEQAVPVHQFRFDSVAWNRHLKEGSLGPAYFCFIPYTRRGIHEANCSIHVKFTPKEGTELLSDASQIVLQGKSKNEPDDEGYVTSNPLVYQTSRTADVKDSRTTTIPLEQRRPARSIVERTHADADQGVVPASYSTEDRTRQVLEDYAREKEAIAPARLPTETRTSSRMKLAPAQ
jgi:hypothetical protein